MRPLTAQLKDGYGSITVALLGFSMNQQATGIVLS
jgi:hypothetical protein